VSETEKRTANAQESGFGPLITIVIPALNEERNIPRLEKELLSVVDPLPYRFEFILIDNDSSDRTGELAKDLCTRDPRWKYLKFSRNFTAEMSITAGYHFAAGDAIIVLYSDLQDPPDLIPRFIEKWREGYDVVYGVHTARHGDPAWRSFSARLAYRMINWLSEVRIPRDAGDYRLITRQVRDAVDRCGEYNRYMRGLIAWLGFRQIGIPYARRPRESGATSWSFWPIIFYTFNALTSFTMKPLRLFTLMGFAFLFLSFVATIVYAVLWYFGTPVRGLTTIYMLLLAAIGFNSLGIGILGEYVGRMYAEVKHRPLYVVHEAVNIEHPDLVSLPRKAGG